MCTGGVTVSVRGSKGSKGSKVSKTVKGGKVGKERKEGKEGKVGQVGKVGKVGKIGKGKSKGKSKGKGEEEGKGKGKSKSKEKSKEKRKENFATKCFDVMQTVAPTYVLALYRAYIQKHGKKMTYDSFRQNFWRLRKMKLVKLVGVEKRVFGERRYYDVAVRDREEWRKRWYDYYKRITASVR